MPFAVPRLAGLATAVPRHVLRQEDVMARAAYLLPAVETEAMDRLMPVYGHAGIERRRSCVPAEWYEIPHGWPEKNQLFLKNAVDLIEEAARRAIDRAGLSPAAIDAVISVSTTGIATPSLDALLAERMSLRRDIERLPVFGLGCAGGVLGLSRAATIARADPEKIVLLVVVELCALTFRRSDSSTANVVATALFGDGAAAAVVCCRGTGPTFEHAGEHLWRDSLDIMGWRVEDDGLGVVFSRDIPALTRTEFRQVVHDFLACRSLDFDDIDGFVCHPGGAKVLDALEDAFGLARGALTDSRAVLREYGNMSAVTVLFVLERMLAAGAKGRLLLSSLGPGFTAAYLTLLA